MQIVPQILCFGMRSLLLTLVLLSDMLPSVNIKKGARMSLRERSGNKQLDYIWLRQLIFKIYNGDRGGGWEKMEDVIRHLPMTPEERILRYYMVLMSVGLRHARPISRPVDEALFSLVYKLLGDVSREASSQEQLEVEMKMGRKEPA
jgi:hypothetical protein